MLNRNLFFVLVCSIFLLISIAHTASAKPKGNSKNNSAPVTCTDNDGDTYAVEGGECGPIDCDDTNPDVNPGAAEVCDGVDTNCDGFRLPTDVDNDGDGYPLCANDCDDNDPDAFPGNPEICDGIDNDCNYVVPLDEQDMDGDGYLSCDGDCDDNDLTVFTGALEECDFKDNDCNAVVDDACVCVDSDGDGQLPDHPTCGGQDCNNNDPDIYTGAPEYCDDGKDNDCDSIVDIRDPDAVNCPVECVDNDGDTFFIDSSNSGVDCGTPDCDDTDPNVNPDATEVCDGKDTDCDGWRLPTDVDNDGDGVPLCNTDCDDNDPDNYPGNIEVCDDGQDNNCNGAVDASDSQCQFSCVTDPTTKNGPHMFNLVTGSTTKTSCNWCHYDDSGTVWEPTACQRCHADSADTADPLNGVLKDLYPAAPPYGFGTALNVQMHSSQVVGTKYGNWDMSCLNCHNPHADEQNDRYGTTYGKLVKEYICYDNVVTGGYVEELIEFTSDTGAGSFADGPPHNENICEMCHTQTNHHQSDGSAPGGQSHYDSEACTYCHAHESGFKASAPDDQGHQTHISGVNGPQISCDSPGGGCHGSSSPPLFADGNDLVNTTVCDNCHSPGGIYDGVNDAVSGAKNNWPDGVYDGTALIAGRLQAGKEMWCAGCHDDAPANSKIDGTGVSARNVVGDGSTYGFYDSGHGKTGSIDCTHCHSTVRPHIDHQYVPIDTIAFPYSTTSNPTYYRFYFGKGMELPYDVGVEYPYQGGEIDGSDFQLCFTCHDESWYTDNTSSFVNLETNFRSNYPSTYKNLHARHLFYYGTTCVYCHDPHGTNNPRMTEASRMGDYRVLRFDSNDAKHYELTDPLLWNSSANAGGAVTTDPACNDCHGEATDLASGLGSADRGYDGWYLRTYKDHSADYLINFDFDGDGLSDEIDNCEDVSNPGQADIDLDGVGDACDNCLMTFNTDQADSDYDGPGDVCDSCPYDDLDDTDGDGLCADVDVCPFNPANPDADSDLACDDTDNCLGLSNPTQSDVDSDNIGDDCDSCPNDPDNDADSDGVCGDVDICPFDALDDIDGDGLCADVDNCPNIANPDQADFDEDGNGDVCDSTCDIASTVPLWNANLGTYYKDYGRDIVLDGNGSFYVTGNTEGSYGGTNQGYKDMFAAKYTTDGSSVWTAQKGTASADNGISIDVDANGNVYVTGDTSGDLAATNQGFADTFITRFNADGTSAWTVQRGTTYNDFGMGIAVAPNDFLYATGRVNGELVAGQLVGSDDLYLMKYDLNGNEQWTKQFGSTSIDIPYDIAVDSSGNSIYMTGYVRAALPGNTFKGSLDAFLIKYSSDGSHQWSVQFGTSGADAGDAVAVDASGNIYVAGRTTGDIDGAGPDVLVGVNDVFLAKYDAIGSQLWIRQAGSVATDLGTGVAVDSSGNVFVSGTTNGDFAGTNEGETDFIIVKFDSNGGLLWKRQMGGYHNDNAQAIAVDSAGDTYLVGDSPAPLGNPSNGNWDATVIKSVEDCP